MLFLNIASLAGEGTQHGPARRRTIELPPVPTGAAAPQRTPVAGPRARPGPKPRRPDFAQVAGTRGAIYGLDAYQRRRAICMPERAENCDHQRSPRDTANL